MCLCPEVSLQRVDTLPPVQQEQQDLSIGMMASASIALCMRNIVRGNRNIFMSPLVNPETVHSSPIMAVPNGFTSSQDYHNALQGTSKLASLMPFYSMLCGPCAGR